MLRLGALFSRKETRRLMLVCTASQKIKREESCGKSLPMDPRLCSRHFSPEAFDAFSRPMLMKELTGGGNYKRRLKPDAVLHFSHTNRQNFLEKPLKSTRGNVRGRTCWIISREDVNKLLRLTQPLVASNGTRSQSKLWTSPTSSQHSSP